MFVITRHGPKKTLRDRCAGCRSFDTSRVRQYYKFLRQVDVRCRRIPATWTADPPTSIWRQYGRTLLLRRSL